MKIVVITGGTSGIGYALTQKYLEEGNVVAVISRTKEKLDCLESNFSNYNNTLETYIADVSSSNEMQDTINKIHSKHKRIDLIFANAGVSAGVIENGTLTKDSSEILKVAHNIFNINVLGVFNTVHPVLEIMQNQRFGNVVIISSMSAFFGLKSAVFYASSKAAVRSYGEGLRALVKNYNINVSLVFPGFVKSNITDKNNFKMPMIMEANKAANIIYKKVNANKGYIIFPRLLFISTYFVSILPAFLKDYIIKKLPDK